MGLLRKPGGNPESLQVCPLAFAPRVERHNNLCKFVAGRLVKKSWVSLQEPIIPTPEVRRKPDLVIYRRGSNVAYVIYANITFVAVSPSHAHREKVRYYDKAAIRAFVKEIS